MSGIKAHFVNPLELRYICGLCKFAMNLPVQTNCGHIFCNECIKNNGKLCPIDGVEITQVENRMLYAYCFRAYTYVTISAKTLCRAAIQK